MSIQPRTHKYKKNRTPNDLSAEITRLREIIQQAGDLAGPEATKEELLPVLATLSEATARLATLLKAQRDLAASNGPESERQSFIDEMRAAIDQTAREISPELYDPQFGLKPGAAAESADTAEPAETAGAGGDPRP